MELRINDYVRFKTLSREIKIGKVIEIVEPDKESMKRYCVYDLDNNETTIDDYVIKSSPNIIELIQVGDYINGMKITNKYIDEETGNIELEFNNGSSYLYPKSWNYEARSEEYKIESIVTKEQFESMEYKVNKND